MASRLATRHAFSFAFVSLAIGAAAACSSSTTPTATAPAGLTCASPGEATPGPADMHCVGQPTQEVNASSCFVTDAGATTTDMDANSGDETDDAGTGDDAGAPSPGDCAYGATMFGGTDGGGAAAGEGDDDDCKYHVSWTSTPICQSAALGVTFTVNLTNLTTQQPVTDIPASEGILVEAFIPTSLDAACDTQFTHFSPTKFAPGYGLLQTSPGVYVGSVIFDQPGEWTLRFHIHEECSDVLADSPHGHAAFHINIP